MEFNKPIQTLAAWRMDDKEREKSSSGGVAAALSECWIKRGGVVYGAAFVPPFSVKHIRCTTLDEIALLRGSKYVQSSLTGIIKLIDEDLAKGIEVLFIGTPCQVAGIISRYGSKVYTIDIICHGTPTINKLKESLPEAVLNIDFDNIEFRNNNEYKLSFKKEGEIVWTRSLSNDIYLKGFFAGLFFRECCYSCKFARRERVSDVTIGDFWGIDKKILDTDVTKGVSMVLVNTQVGLDLVEMIRQDVEIIERSLDEAVKGNGQLSHPMRHTFRAKIFKFFYPKIGFRWATILSIPDVVIKNIFFK